MKNETDTIEREKLAKVVAERARLAEVVAAIQDHYIATTTLEQRAADRAREDAHYEDGCMEHQSGGGGW